MDLMFLARDKPSCLEKYLNKIPVKLIKHTINIYFTFNQARDVKLISD